MDNVWRQTQGVESLGNQLLLHLRDLTRIALPNELLDMRTDLFGCVSRVEILDNEFQCAYAVGAVVE